MDQPGRKSAARLAVVVPLGVTKITPPKDLTAAQAEVWRAVISTKPADWFQPDSAPLLYEYCRAKTAADVIAAQVDAFDPAWLADEQGLRRYETLMRMQGEKAKLLAMLAVKMRLAQQSRYTPQAASTANKKAGGDRPWHRVIEN